jgi:hypothetical protein
VEHRALEALEPLDRGVVLVVERPTRRDQDVRLALLPRAGLDEPLSALVAGARDLVIELDVREDLVLLRHALEVGQDLGLGGEAVCPLRVQLEAVGVEVRRHVAGEPGVGVLAPGPAEGRLLLVDLKVLDPGLLQPDAHQQAGHTGADDADLQVA